MSAIYVQSTEISDGKGTEFFKLVREPLLLKHVGITKSYLILCSYLNMDSTL